MQPNWYVQLHEHQLRLAAAEKSRLSRLAQDLARQQNERKQNPLRRLLAALSRPSSVSAWEPAHLQK
jgi:CRISPR/Cas system-associated protein Csm6